MYPVGAHGGHYLLYPYISGTLLACAENRVDGETRWDFPDTAVNYSAGNWTQYGPLASTPAYRMEITVPEGELWVVYIEFNANNIYTLADGAYPYMGIQKWAANSGNDDNNQYYAGVMLGFNATKGYQGIRSGQIFELEAGVHRFSLWIMNYTNGGMSFNGKTVANSAQEDWTSGCQMS